MRHASITTAVAALGIALVAALGSCSTEPKAEDRPQFISSVRSSTDWFERNVSGLSSQIDNAAGYIIFPDIIQYGIIFSGGTMGRGMLCRPDGRQIGWAAINAGSIGLQAGVQGMKMLLVLQDEDTVNRFMEGELSGSVEGILVVSEEGGSTQAPFDRGVAVYQGANQGLMAGVRVGLDYVRYKPLDSTDRPADNR